MIFNTAVVKIHHQAHKQSLFQVIHFIQVPKPTGEFLLHYVQASLSLGQRQISLSNTQTHCFLMLKKHTTTSQLFLDNNLARNYEETVLIFLFPG